MMVIDRSSTVTEVSGTERTGGIELNEYLKAHLLAGVFQQQQQINWQNIT